MNNSKTDSSPLSQDEFLGASDCRNGLHAWAAQFDPKSAVLASGPPSERSIAAGQFLFAGLRRRLLAHDKRELEAAQNTEITCYIPAGSSTPHSTLDAVAITEAYAEAVAKAKTVARRRIKLEQELLAVGDNSSQRSATVADKATDPQAKYPLSVLATASRKELVTWAKAEGINARSKSKKLIKALKGIKISSDDHFDDDNDEDDDDDDDVDLYNQSIIKTLAVEIGQASKDEFDAEFKLRQAKEMMNELYGANNDDEMKVLPAITAGSRNKFLVAKRTKKSSVFNVSSGSAQHKVVWIRDPEHNAFERLVKWICERWYGENLQLRDVMDVLSRSTFDETKASFDEFVSNFSRFVTLQREFVEAVLHTSAATELFDKLMAEQCRKALTHPQKGASGNEIAVILGRARRQGKVWTNVEELVRAVRPIFAERKAEGRSVAKRQNKSKAASQLQKSKAVVCPIDYAEPISAPLHVASVSATFPPATKTSFPQATTVHPGGEPMQPHASSAITPPPALFPSCPPDFDELPWHARQHIMAIKSNAEWRHCGNCGEEDCPGKDDYGFSCTSPICGNCGEEGHKRGRQCVDSNGNRKPKTVCTWCGLSGHLERICFRKKKGHPKTFGIRPPGPLAPAPPVTPASTNK